VENSEILNFKEKRLNKRNKQYQNKTKQTNQKKQTNKQKNKEKERKRNKSPFLHWIQSILLKSTCRC